MSWGRGLDEWLQTHGYQAVRILHADTPVCLSERERHSAEPLPPRTPRKTNILPLIIFLSLIIIER